MKLISKLIIVFLPTSLLFLIIFVFSIMTNELYIFANVVDSQNGDELYGVAFSDHNVEYKLRNLVKRNPDIAIIGTSRVMEFRSEFFEGQSIYNAGGIVSQIGHLRPLLEHLIIEDAVPDTIIVGLDQYFFNVSWDSVRASDANNYTYRLRNLPVIVIPNRLRMVEVIFTQPKLLMNISLLSSNNIGLQGKYYNQGFRHDGSYYYGKYYEHGINNDYDFVNTLNRIEYGKSRFEYGVNFNPKSLDELNLFLLLAEQNGINVVGFMPPFAPSINKIMVNSGNYLYINRASDAISELFAQYDFKYFDFTSMPDTFDFNYIDGFHGDMYVYAKIANEIAEFIN